MTSLKTAQGQSEIKTVTRLVVSLFVLLFSIFLLLFFQLSNLNPASPKAASLSLVTSVSAQGAQCTPSCAGGYDCSLGIECCRCVYDDGAGEVGPVTCCTPPGPSSGSCRTYPVTGCKPGPGSTPPPSPGPTPPPPAPEVRPIPTPYVPCDETRSPEFHSLRPYQASPCNQEVSETALFCGNDLIVADAVTRARGQADSCTDNGDGTETCTFTVNRSREIAIDLSGAELPIMGYTEPSLGNQSDPARVINSVYQDETVDDAEKVNEYVSWYLNGVIGRAEYPPEDPDSEEGRKKIIDFSGPLKKLLSWTSQAQQRIKTIGNAGDNRHNQIIGCVDSSDNPVSCYTDLGKVDERIRLTDLRNRLPPLPQDFNSPKDFLRAYRRWVKRSLTNLFSYVPFSSTEDRKGLVSTQTVSVQPVSPDLTISNVSFTNQSPAELFFTHMQEASELARLLQQTIVSSGGPIDELTTSQVSPSQYCDLVQIRSNPGDNLFAGEISGTLSYTAEFSCDFPIPGDGTLCRGITAGAGNCVPSDFICNTNYGPVDCPLGQICGVSCTSSPPAPICNGATAGAGNCVPNSWTCSGPGYGQLDCPANYQCGIGCSSSSQECTKDIHARLSLITETPKANEVWSRLVAGPASVFKRIFPKIGEGAPLLGILDLPAATKVTYSSPGLIYAGNPGTLRSGESAELYFPHIGGVHEYFLQCIQTTLRPKGFGEVCESGAAPDEIVGGDCDQSVPDSAIPSKYSGSFKQNVINLANNWTADCPGSQNNLADECYNDVVKRAVDSKVNVGYTLLTWLYESGASNYCHGGATTQDFGINDASIFQNFGAQIERFLGLPRSGLYTYCSNQSGFDSRMHAFLVLFKSGDCNPANAPGNNYYNNIRNRWSWVSGSCAFPSYPTDTSCP